MDRLAVTIVLVLAGGLLWGAATTARRSRDAPGADLFAVVAGLTGTGALAVATSLVLTLPDTVRFASTLVIALLLPVPWLLFALEYTGRGDLVSPGTAVQAALLPAVGLLATALIIGSRLLPWLRLPSRTTASGLAAVTVALLSLVQWLALLYAGGLILIGSGVVLWTFHRYEHLDSTAGMLLGIFGTVPWLALLLGFQVASVDPLALPGITAIGFLSGGAAAAVGLGRRHLFQNVPAAGAAGPKTVIEELEDVVVVTDGDGTVVRINPSAERELATTAAGVVGADVGELLDVPLADVQASETVELQSRSGRKLFEPKVSELTDQHDHCLGYAIVLRDVTARTTRQQRLEVLNRILRHNLRNDMNVILGHAGRLEEEVDDPTLAGSAEAIVRAGQNLTELSEEARQIEQLMATTEMTAQEVRLAPLAEHVLEVTAGDHQRVTTDYDVPSDIVVEGTSDLLELALTNLVENAIEHADSEDAHVSITADYDPDQTYPLTVSVVDDGPGIPVHEKRVIEQGAETPLQHGSSLGLWQVRWVVNRMGGELDLQVREPHGTTASIRLPRVHRGEPEPETPPGDAGE